MGTLIDYVEIDDDDDEWLLVRWGIDGDPVDVDISLGTSSEAEEHRPVATVPATEASYRLPRLPGERQFVSVAPHGGGPTLVGGERRVPFDNISNFRDIGGYRTKAGGRLRWGMVYRSDALYGMSESDLALFHRLGVQSVYDLRREAECEERPNPVPSYNLPILSRPPDDNAPLNMVGVTGEDGERILLDIYTGHVDHAAESFGELLTAIAEPGGVPFVFHCHAGKDRTGLSAALLLEALGVERATVLDDYVLTARYWRRTEQDKTLERLITTGLPPEAAAGILTAPLWVLASALEYLDREHGGIEPYLTGPAGMDPAAVRRLSEELVGP